MENTAQTASGSLVPMGGVIGSQKPMFELPQIGETLVLRYHPFDRMRASLPTDAHTSDETVVEVQVVAIKKAKVIFE